MFHRFGGLRQLSAALLALANLFVCVRQMPAQVPDVATKEFRLDNGLKVVFHQDRTVPRVNVIVAFHVGSKNERPGRTGFAHFFEHMMFRGTKHVPNYDKPLQEAGATSNAYTTEDMTVYFETVPTNFLERALYLEADRLAWLPTALDQEKFDTEREVVKNERRQSYENVPYGLAEETILANLYPAGHPYRWSVIGSMDDLNRATLNDLKAFFAEFYHPANATLCLTGDFDPDQAEKLIRKYFTPIPAGAMPGRIIPPAVETVDKSVTLVDKVAQPRLYQVWHAVDDNAADAPALELLGQLMSAGEASRLYERIVIRDQSATSVSLSFVGSEVDGYLQLAATIAPGRTIEEVEKAVHEEIARIRSEAPSKRELDRLKAQYELAAFVPLEDPQSLGFTLATGSAQYGDSKRFRKKIDRVLAVEPDRIRAVADKYLLEKKLRLVVRPAAEGEEKTPAVKGVGPLATGAEEAARRFVEPAASTVDWSAMPGPAQRPEYMPPEYAVRKLSNGLELWHVRKDSPLVHMELSLLGGSLDDPAELDGIAALTGAMMDKGTKSKTNRELTEAFELLGSTPDIGIGDDRSSISITLLPRNAGPALGLISELLREPRLEAEEFDRQKKLMTAALKRGPDSPAYLASRAFARMVYGSGSRFGHPADGTMASLDRIDPANVAEFLKNLADPAAARLFVVGPLTTDEAVTLIEKNLADWKTAANRHEAQPARPAEAVTAQAGVVYLVDKPGAVQSVIRVGRRWKPRSDTAAYLPGRLGNYTLGGDFLSRLNQNLREKNGFSYGAGSGFSYAHGGERWTIATSVRTDATGAALKEIFNELDGLLAGGKVPLTDVDFGLAVEALIQSFPEGFSTAADVLAALQELADFGLDRSEWTNYVRRVGAVPKAAVSQVMAELVAPESRVVVIAGDRKTIEADLKKNGFERIVVIPVSDLTDAVAKP